MNINMSSIKNMIDIPICITTKDSQAATQDNVHLQNLRMYIIEGLPSNRNDVKQDI